MIEKKLWNSYCSTVVAFKDDKKRSLRIVPTSGIVGTWLDGPQIKEIFIVSATNPHSEKLTDDVNLKSEVMMQAVLDSYEFKYQNCQGESPDGIWVERSLMVFNAPLETIMKIGKDYLQNAIFRWTPNSWECISLVSDQYFLTGWILET